MKQLNDFPHELPWIPHSKSQLMTVPGEIQTDTVRAMRNYAARLGAEMPRYLLAPEIAVLLSCFDDLSQRMYFDTLWNTGARLNEALALTPACFTLEPERRHPQPVITLKTLKQREREANRGRGRPVTKAPAPATDRRYQKPPEPATRTVPLLDATYVCRMREYLATWKKRIRHQPVWPVSSRQTPLNWLNAALKRAASDGVTFPFRVTPHTFRHSYAMHLMMNGIPQKVLQSLMGHRYSRSTEVYTRVFSLDVLTGHGLLFTIDATTARSMLD